MLFLFLFFGGEFSQLGDFLGGMLNNENSRKNANNDNEKKATLNE
jgi:hypothetical protein